MPHRRVKYLRSTSMICAVVLFGCGGDGTAPAPTATKLVFVVPPSAVAETMVPLPVQPVVQTVDANGQAVPATVSIAVNVVNGNGAVVTSGVTGTDAAGRATFAGLTLGAVNTLRGPLTLRFSAPGLQSISANVDLQCAVIPIAIDQAVSRSLSTGDCGGNGTYETAFALSTSQPVTVLALGLESAFRPGLFFRGANEPIGGWGFLATAPGAGHVAYDVLFPAGKHRVWVAGLDPGATGAYTLTVHAASTDINCFALPFAASPITTSQALGSGVFDCVEGSFYYDRLLVGLPANSTITASMTSTAFQPVVKLVHALSDAAVAMGTGGSGPASLTFTNGATGVIHYLVMTSVVAGATGPYTLALNITYPGSSSTSAIQMPDPQKMAALTTPVMKHRGVVPWMRPGTR